MERTEFEPFGEEIKLSDSAQVRSNASRVLVWIGSGTFWILAGTIVIARAIYFDPRILEGFEQVISLLHSVTKG